MIPISLPVGGRPRRTGRGTRGQGYRPRLNGRDRAAGPRPGAVARHPPGRANLAATSSSRARATATSPESSASNAPATRALTISLTLRHSWAAPGRPGPSSTAVSPRFFVSCPSLSDAVPACPAGGRSFKSRPPRKLGIARSFSNSLEDDRAGVTCAGTCWPAPPRRGC
jgi:hypothetical protein